MFSFGNPAQTRSKGNNRIHVNEKGNIGGSVVQYVVGNTYKRIPYERAAFDRTGTTRKIHDWTVYLDVVSGDPDLVRKVTFDLGNTFTPQSYACTVPVKDPKTGHWRFSSRQQSFGAPQATIVVQGAGGSIAATKHQIVAEGSGNSSSLMTFTETNPINPFPSCKMPPNQRFAVVFELTCPWDSEPEIIANGMVNRIGDIIGSVQVIRSYSEARTTWTNWKIVPDSSISGGTNSPEYNSFQLISPMLVGGTGLTQVSQVLEALGHIQPQLIVNKSLGFHVHVDVSALGIPELVKICQNFVKYEDVMDSFMPPERWTGSEQSEAYFRSNRHPGYPTNLERHRAIGNCKSLHQLSRVMNPGGRCHKLSLQSLVTGRQTTLEFRQHPATSSVRKVLNWVRFCVAFCGYSAKLSPPKNFKEGRSLDDQFDALFQYVVKDRSLRNYYKERRSELRKKTLSADKGRPERYNQ